MEKDRRYEKERGKESRERVEISGDKGKKERSKQVESNGGKKCFECGGFSYMASNYRNMKKEEPIPVSSNRFEVLKVRVMQRGKGSGKEIVKDRKEILREEKAKRKVKRKRRRKRC